MTNKKKLLEGKAFGCISVGAKRNGGQETTIIYALYEALMQNSIVVGNGPGTSQYGGTAWAGDPHKVLEDNFGLDTCYGTGSRVANLSTILKKARKSDNKTALNITVLVTMDTRNRKYETITKNYFSKYAEDHAINIINVTDYDIYRCVACGICPSPVARERNQGKEGAYNCIIQTKKDSLKTLHQILLNSDCVIVVGANTQDDLIYRYQAFMERTRFIRRGDFEMTNTPVISLLINETGSINNPLHNVKVLTSYMRHNTFVLKPIELTYHDGMRVFEDDFNERLKILNRIKKGRKIIKATAVSYEATGYGDKRLDSTSAVRK